MNDAEKRLRAFISERVYSADAERENNALLDVALAASRDAALEEASGIVAAHASENCECRDTTQCLRIARGEIAALQSAPAQVVSKAKVREVLMEIIDPAQRIQSGAGYYPESQGRLAAAQYIARALGVDLDAAPAKDEACDWCGRPRSKHDAQGSIPEECGGFIPNEDGSR